MDITHLIAMDATVVRAMIAIGATAPLSIWSAFRFGRGRRFWAGVQVAGAVGLLTVAIAHLCEGLRLFPEMEWGKPRSAGHYVDLAAAILGLTLFPLGYLRSRRS